MILLTGDKGFVGSEIGLSLSDRGHAFIGIDRPASFYLWHERVDRLFKEYRFDAVIAAGAISDNQYKRTDIYTWNALAMEILASYCVEQGALMIFFSSQTARCPTTLYGCSKRLAEMLIEGKRGLEACILQPFNIWGAGEAVKPLRLRSLPFRLVNEELEVLWPTRRDYVHVSDVVSAVFHALKGRLTGTFEVGTGGSVHAYDLAACTEWQGYEKQPTPRNIEKWTCADPKRFLPGWHPKVKVLNGMRQLKAERCVTEV